MRARSRDAGDIMEAGHLHRCREGHAWYHAGPTARMCRIPEHVSPAGGRHISPEDCALCTGRDDLLTRGLHAHRCPTCDGSWTHEGRCAEDFAAQCPWCFRRPEADAALGMRTDAHRHFCPACRQTWEHWQLCVAPLRAVLAECPGCQGSIADAGGWSAESPVEPPGPSLHRASGGARSRWRPRVKGAAVLLGAVALGAALRMAFAPSDAPRNASPPPAPPAVSSESPAPPPAALEDPAQAAFQGVTPPSPGAESPPAQGAVAGTTKPEAPVASRPPRTRSGPSAGTAQAPPEVASPPRAGPPVERCEKPSTPSVAVSADSGKPLGMWVDVKIDRAAQPERCLYVVQRGRDTLWVLEASRVRIAPQ